MGFTDGGIGTRLGCFVQTLTYTGDGAISQHIDTNITPIYVKIWNRETVEWNDIQIYETTNTINDDHADGGTIIIMGGIVQFTINRIPSLDADGFTVDDGGADLHPNKNGQVYNVLVLGY